MTHKTQGIKHFEKAQILHYHEVYTVIRGEHQEVINEPMRLAYSSKEQLEALFQEAELIIEQCYGSWDFGPVREDRQQELIFILSKF